MHGLDNLHQCPVDHWWAQKGPIWLEKCQQGMHIVAIIVCVTRITPWHNHPVCHRVVIPVRGSHLRLHSNIASVCVPVISNVFWIYLSCRLASINHCHLHRRHHLGCLHLDTRWQQSRWCMWWGWLWPMAIPREKRHRSRSVPCSPLHISLGIGSGRVS